MEKLQPWSALVGNGNGERTASRIYERLVNSRTDENLYYRLSMADATALFSYLEKYQPSPETAPLFDELYVLTFIYRDALHALHPDET